jgi:hypothetical protein
LGFIHRPNLKNQQKANFSRSKELEVHGAHEAVKTLLYGSVMHLQHMGAHCGGRGAVSCLDYAIFLRSLSVFLVKDSNVDIL